MYNLPAVHIIGFIVTVLHKTELTNVFYGNVLKFLSHKTYVPLYNHYL